MASSFPVSFDKFKKDPTKAILYLAIIAIMYLYIDNRLSYTKQIEYLMEQNVEKEKKIEKLQKDVIDLSMKIAEISK